MLVVPLESTLWTGPVPELEGTKSVEDTRHDLGMISKRVLDDSTTNGT